MIMTFKELFNSQLMNQLIMLQRNMYDSQSCALPCDDIKLMSYHVQGLVAEIGELLAADKRWKNFRNTKYSQEEKLEEIADCFIMLMNVAMFSNIDAQTLEKSIAAKIDKVSTRIKENNS